MSDGDPTNRAQYQRSEDLEYRRTVEDEFFQLVTIDVHCRLRSSGWYRQVARTIQRKVSRSCAEVPKKTFVVMVFYPYPVNEAPVQNR
jgi:hypothetical protein